MAGGIPVNRLFRFSRTFERDPAIGRWMEENSGELGSIAQRWFQVKIVLLVAMLAYHLRCRHWIRLLAARTEPQETKGLRWFNEIPVIFLLGIVCLAVLKPF